MHLSCGLQVLLGITSQALGMKAYEAEMALRATHRDEAFASILKSQADAINEMLQARNYMESEESQEVLYEVDDNYLLVQVCCWSCD